MYIDRIAENNILRNLDNKKILILLGARQVGKTTLIKKTLQSKKTAFLNFDIEVDKQRFLAVSKLQPSEVSSFFQQPDFLVIDEVQRLPEVPRIIKGWYDSGLDIKLILLGSSSFDIQNKMVESLAGRNIKIILPPLLFKEIIAEQEWNSGAFEQAFLLENFYPQIKTLLTQSIIFGNYPEAVTTADKPALLMNLINDYLFKDVLQIGLIKTPDLIRKLLMLLAHQLGSEVSVSELATALGMSRVTVERYLFLLEQSYVIFRLPAFSTNPRKEITKNHKIYFWDTGIRNALLNDFNFSEMRADIGALWENWVIAEIAKDNALNDFRKNLYFWRTRSGSEVDLVVKKDDTLNAYEIKWSDRKQRLNKAFFNQYKTTVKLITKNLNTGLPILK